MTKTQGGSPEGSAAMRGSGRGGVISDSDPNPDGRVTAAARTTTTASAVVVVVGGSGEGGENTPHARASSP